MLLAPVPTGAAPGARQQRHLSLCLVMGEFPRHAEPLVAREIGALRALGHAVVPVTLGMSATAVSDPALRSEEAMLRIGAIRIESVETLAALSGAAANPAGLAAAVGFAQRQRGMPRRTLLRAAARLAHVAKAHGCTHLHAHFAHSAADAAICAARIAGLTASFTIHAADLSDSPGTAELALRLAAADLSVAVSETIAKQVRRLAPHARIRAIPPGHAGRLAAALAELRA